MSITKFHFSLIESMSDTLEQAVDETIGDNHKVLEEKFDSQHEIGHAGTDFTAVQDMGKLVLQNKSLCLFLQLQ